MQKTRLESLQPSFFVFSFDRYRKEKPVPSHPDQSKERKGCGHSAGESSEKSQEAWKELPACRSLRKLGQPLFQNYLPAPLFGFYFRTSLISSKSYRLKIGKGKFHKKNSSENLTESFCSKIAFQKIWRADFSLKEPSLHEECFLFLEKISERM